MKIVFFVKNLDIGGAEKHLLTILPHLTRYASLEVFTLDHKGVLAPQFEKLGIPVHTALTDQEENSLTRFPKFLRKIFRYLILLKNLVCKIKNEKDSILHFFLPEPYILGTLSSLLANFKGVRILSRRSLNDYQKRRPLIGWIERRLHKFTKFATGNSLQVLLQLQEEGLNNTRLIYNGIQTEAFSKAIDRKALRHQLNIETEALVFVCVANLIPYKGHKDLLEALHEIQADLPPHWNLLCIGGDPQGYLKTLQNESQNLGLEAHLKWLGTRTDIPDILRCADIAILASHEEGFANAILESMAAGLPVVATNVGGNAEAVVHGKTGFIVPAKEPKVLAKALLNLASDRKLAKEMGKKGLDRLHENFSLEACIQGYWELYESTQNQTQNLKEKVYNL